MGCLHADFAEPITGKQPRNRARSAASPPPPIAPRQTSRLQPPAALSADASASFPKEKKNRPSSARPLPKYVSSPWLLSTRRSPAISRRSSFGPDFLPLQFVIPRFRWCSLSHLNRSILRHLVEFVAPSTQWWLGFWYWRLFPPTGLEIFSPANFVTTKVNWFRALFPSQLISSSSILVLLARFGLSSSILVWRFWLPGFIDAIHSSFCYSSLTDLFHLNLCIAVTCSQERSWWYSQRFHLWWVALRSIIWHFDLLLHLHVPHCFLSPLV